MTDSADFKGLLTRLNAGDAQQVHDQFVQQFRLLINPVWRFFKEYILKRGFMDGTPGLISAVSSAYYVFLKYAKLWELEHRRKNGP